MIKRLIIQAPDLIHIFRKSNHPRSSNYVLKNEIGQKMPIYKLWISAMAAFSYPTLAGVIWIAERKVHFSIHHAL